MAPAPIELFPSYSSQRFWPEIVHRGQPIGLRILLRPMALESEVGGPAPREAFSRTDGGDGGVSLMLVIPIGTNPEPSCEARLVKLKRTQQDLGMRFRDR